VGSGGDGLSEFHRAWSGSRSCAHIITPRCRARPVAVIARRQQRIIVRTLDQRWEEGELSGGRGAASGRRLTPRASVPGRSCAVYELDLEDGSVHRHDREEQRRITERQLQDRAEDLVNSHSKGARACCNVAWGASRSVRRLPKQLQARGVRHVDAVGSEFATLEVREQCVW